LEILLQLAGLPNNAPPDSTIEDALEILMFLAGLPSVHEATVVTTASGTTKSASPTTTSPTTTTPTTTTIAPSWIHCSECYVNSVLAVIHVNEPWVCKDCHDSKTTTTTEPAQQEFIPAVADLSIDLFRRAFAEDSTQNTLVSPLSVLLALTMTANGADGQTLSEMEEVLGRGFSIDDLNKLLRDYVSSLPSTDDSSLSIANSIWFTDCPTITIFETFLQANREYFDSEVFRRDFVGNEKATVEEINAWVAENTLDMITEIIDKIDELAIMFLINAIAFDAKWAVPFCDKGVRKRDFTAHDGTVQNVEFMSTNLNNHWGLRYIETENARGFTKPYMGNHYSFAALLPNADIDIADFIADMTGEGLMTALNSARRPNGGVIATMPKFNFEYGINMGDVLKEMGMPTAFCDDSADFTRLGKADRPLDTIYIKNVIHNTFIEVDQIGTRAAAVTLVEMGTPTSVPPPPQIVTLDRPFVFMIIDNATNLPIFIGTLLEV